MSCNSLQDGYSPEKVSIFDHEYISFMNDMININHSGASTNGCKHNISQTGFTAIIKGNSSCKCPVAGCSGVWKKDSTIVDKHLQLQMDKFYRMQTQSQSSSQYR